jgi:hypothetical protein
MLLHFSGWIDRLSPTSLIARIICTYQMQSQQMIIYLSGGANRPVSSHHLFRATAGQAAVDFSYLRRWKISTFSVTLFSYLFT